MKQLSIGAACVFVGATSIALAQTAVRPDQFTGLPWTWTATQTFDGTHKISGLPTPAASSDAATKGYADSLVTGGTLTSITCNGGLSGGTITTTGTCALDTTNANTWSGLQQFNSAEFKLKGGSSGTITLNAAAAAGTNTLTLPAGTTDFSATGGTSQVVTQTSAGGPLSVARLACADLSDSAAGCSTATGSGGSSIPLLNTANAWGAPQRVKGGSVTISTSTFTPDLNTQQDFEILLVHASCPCTIANPSNIASAAADHQHGVVRITQSSTGSDTVGTWGSQWIAGGGTSTLTLSAGANAQDYFAYDVVDSTHILITPVALNASH